MTTGMDSLTGGPKAEGTAIAFVNPSSVRFPYKSESAWRCHLCRISSSQPSLPTTHPS